MLSLTPGLKRTVCAMKRLWLFLAVAILGAGFAVAQDDGISLGDAVTPTFPPTSPSTGEGRLPT